MYRHKMIEICAGDDDGRRTRNEEGRTRNKERRAKLFDLTPRYAR